MELQPCLPVAPFPYRYAGARIVLYAFCPLSCTSLPLWDSLSTS